MNDVRSLVDKFKIAGIQPVVTISVDPNTQDIQAVKALLANLKNAGITAQVQIQLTPTSAPGAETITQEIQPPTSQDRLGMVVKETRLNCLIFRKLDDAGKPDMVFPQQRVVLQKGTKFFVSTTHKAGSKDTGNGIVIGTGNHEYYMVVDCPTNPAAVGLYVRKIDVEPSP